jgi:hypothetical protein
MGGIMSVRQKKRDRPINGGPNTIEATLSLLSTNFNPLSELFNPGGAQPRDVAELVDGISTPVIEEMLQVCDGVDIAPF